MSLTWLAPTTGGALAPVAKATKSPEKMARRGFGKKGLEKRESKHWLKSMNSGRALVPF